MTGTTRGSGAALASLTSPQWSPVLMTGTTRPERRQRPGHCRRNGAPC